MNQRSLLAIGTWVGIAVILWTIAWIISEAIPVFNNLLSLIVGIPEPFYLDFILTIQNRRRHFSPAGLLVSPFNLHCCRLFANLTQTV